MYDYVAFAVIVTVALCSHEAMKESAQQWIKRQLYESWHTLWPFMRESVEVALSKRSSGSLQLNKMNWHYNKDQGSQWFAAVCRVFKDWCPLKAQCVASVLVIRLFNGLKFWELVSWMANWPILSTTLSLNAPITAKHRLGRPQPSFHSGVSAAKRLH